MRAFLFLYSTAATYMRISRFLSEGQDDFIHEVGGTESPTLSRSDDENTATGAPDWLVEIFEEFVGTTSASPTQSSTEDSASTKPGSTTTAPSMSEQTTASVTTSTASPTTVYSAEALVTELPALGTTEFPIDFLPLSSGEAMVCNVYHDSGIRGHELTWLLRKSEDDCLEACQKVSNCGGVVYMEWWRFGFCFLKSKPVSLDNVIPAAGSVAALCS